MHFFNEINLQNLKGDLFGGLTAAIISLPIALAFGIASGVGPEAGLYGAILVGLFAALFGATPTLISEPTGPMTAVMSAIIINLAANNPQDGFIMAFSVVMLAGFLQILFGILKLGNYVTMISYTVVSGFMSGIGVILIITQLGLLLGKNTPSGGVIDTINALPNLVLNANIYEILLALLTMLLIIFIPKKITKYIPSQLLALVVVTIISVLAFDNDMIRRIGLVTIGFPDINMPIFSSEQWSVIAINALVLAVLGSIDALLSSVIAENMTHQQTNSNKELVGQGIGNIASGLCGGLPGAGATMGTVVNIKNGATSALSGLVRVVVLVVTALWATNLIGDIPLVVLVSIIIKIGFDIIDWSFLKRVRVVSTKAAFITYSVIILTVFVDLITAVAVGVFIANILTIERITNVQSESLKTINNTDNQDDLTKDEVEILQQAKGRILIFTLHGPLIFGIAKVIARRYAAFAEHQILLIDFTEVPRLGVSSSLALEKLIYDDIKIGRTVYLAGVSNRVMGRLNNLGVINKITKNNVFTTREQALKHANNYLKN